MKSKESMKIKPFSTDKGWDLFSKVDFKYAEGGHVPKKIKSIAKQVSTKCKGFSLARNVITSSMIGKSNEDEWKLYLRKMEKSLNFIDPIAGHPCIN